MPRIANVAGRKWSWAAALAMVIFVAGAALASALTTAGSHAAGRSVDPKVAAESSPPPTSPTCVSTTTTSPVPASTTPSIVARPPAVTTPTAASGASESDSTTMVSSTTIPTAIVPPPSTTAVVPGPEPAPTPEGQAQQILDAAALPRGAIQVSCLARTALPGAAFAEPATKPACNPLVGATRFWEVPGAPEPVAASLKKDTPPWLSTGGVGETGNVNTGQFYYWVEGIVLIGSNWTAGDSLVFSVDSLADGQTGIREDAEVIPPGSVCASG